MMDHHQIEILLVEDNPSDLELTLLVLRQNKLANIIHVARDGAEALDFLFRRGVHAHRPDAPLRLVLLDLKLPKVDGLEVLQAMRADENTRSIPVVVLTSSREQRDLISAYDFGVNSYIQKPVDFDQFQRTIRQLGLYWLVVNVPPA